MHHRHHHCGCYCHHKELKLKGVRAQGPQCLSLKCCTCLQGRGGRSQADVGSPPWTARVCSAGPRASGLVPRGQAGRRGWGVALRWVWLHQSTNAILVWRGEKGPAWSACAGPGGSSPQASQGSRSRLTMASLGPKETAWAWEMWGLKSFKGKTLGPEARRN